MIVDRANLFHFESLFFVLFFFNLRWLFLLGQICLH